MDARNELDEPRIRHAEVLLENESLGQQIAKLHDKDSHISRSSLVQLRAEAVRTVDRTAEIVKRADELKANLEMARQDLARRKALNARRSADLAAAKTGVELRRTRQLEEVERSTKMSTYKWNKDHNTLAASRAFLCGEAARLYGLRKTRRSDGGEEYLIGNVTIMDLRTLNSRLLVRNSRNLYVDFVTAASPAAISTALSHVVHLLMLSTHYLSIRLPAEITLPHRDYPLPTIFPLATSYKHVDDIPFPGTTPTTSSNTSPSASRQLHPDQILQQRPRPLFVEKPPPILSSEDPSGYKLFIEAVTLLAYDVAWVCKSQGVSIGAESSFEDICDIGKNMYNLLIGNRTRPAPGSRTSSTNSTPTKSGRQSDTGSTRGSSLPTVAMGQWSHGSAHSSLASAAAQEFIRTWKLPSPAKLADKLKSKLMNEVANAEWEVLDEDAWAVEQPEGKLGGDEAVVVGARKSRERGYGLGMQSFMIMRTVNDAVESGHGDGEVDKKQGSNGWTRVKHR